jgi:sugar phosphate permease
MVAIILMLATLAGYLTRVNISVALPFISDQYGWTAAERGVYGGLLLGLFLVGYGISNVFLSPLVDRFGPRRGMMATIVLWSIITFFTGFVGLMLFAFMGARVMLGLSEGPLFPSASTITQRWFEPRDRTRVNSLYFSSLYLSNLIASSLLVSLILITSWQFAFYSVALFGFLIAALVWLFLRDYPPWAPAPKHEPRKEPIRAVVRGAVDDLRQTLRLHGIFILVAADIATSLVWWGISLWLPTYLTTAKGFAKPELVYAASLPYIGGILGLLIGTWISNRSNRHVGTASSFAIIGGVFILFIAPVQSHEGIIAVLFLVFFFIAIMLPNLFTLLQGVCPRGLIGSATGFLNGTAVGLGALGPVILGISVAATLSYDLGLYLMAALQFLSGLVLLLFNRYRGPGTTAEPACENPAP